MPKLLLEEAVSSKTCLTVLDGNSPAQGLHRVIQSNTCSPRGLHLLLHLALNPQVKEKNYLYIYAAVQNSLGDSNSGEAQMLNSCQSPRSSYTKEHWHSGTESVHFSCTAQCHCVLTYLRFLLGLVLRVKEERHVSHKWGCQFREVQLRYLIGLELFLKFHCCKVLLKGLAQ